MKVLVYRYNSICEPDYIEAFKKVGLEVVEVRIEMTEKRLSIDKKVEILGETILTENPLFVFSINFFPFISLVCEKLKLLYVCVSVDCPVVELFSETIKSPYNRVFLFDRAQYNDIHPFNPECVFYQSLGVNTERINNEIGRPIWKGNDRNIDYKYDVSFIGSLYNEKDAYADVKSKLSVREVGYADGLISAQSLFGGQALLEECITDELVVALKSADKNFYPSDMNVMDTDKFVAVNNYLSYHITFLDRVRFLNTVGSMSDLHFFTRSDTKYLKNVNCHGGVSSLKEMPLVFRQSKININTTMRAIRTGMPQRIWDVLGSGGFLLSNYQADMDGELILGKHLVAYESEAEACELISYYLGHDDEREEIAEAGYRYALEKAQVVNRVSEMIRVVLSTLEK